MRRETLLLADIVVAADALAGSLRGRTFDGLVADGDLQASVLYRLIVIGEAAARLPVALRERHPDVPWRSVIGFRNRAVHAYFAMDWDIVWETATVAVPLLRSQVEAIRAEHKSADDPADGRGEGRR